MNKPSEAVRAELEAGISLARLSQLSEIAASTLRNYEKEGLLEPVSADGKKLYGANALESVLEVKRLRQQGLGLKEIASQRGAQNPVTVSAPVQKPDQAQAKATPITSTDLQADLKARIETLREQLNAEKSRLEALVARVGTRQLQRKNELALSKLELEEIQRLRESNVRRALEVTRRAQTVSGKIQYSMSRPGVLRMNAPMVPRKKRK
jgi:DNA-binding transcriptional MerR regulator